jgi:hypothetical protein
MEHRSENTLRARRGNAGAKAETVTTVHSEQC